MSTCFGQPRQENNAVLCLGPVYVSRKMSEGSGSIGLVLNPVILQYNVGYIDFKNSLLEGTLLEGR